MRPIKFFFTLCLTLSLDYIHTPNKMQNYKKRRCRTYATYNVFASLFAISTTSDGRGMFILELQIPYSIDREKEE